MRYMTASKAAKTFGLSRQGITALCRAGKLPAHKFGDRWVINVDEMLKVTKSSQGSNYLTRSEVYDATLALLADEGLEPKVIDGRIAKEPQGSGCMIDEVIFDPD